MLRASLSPSLASGGTRAVWRWQGCSPGAEGPVCTLTPAGPRLQGAAVFWCLPSPGHTVVRAPHSVVPRWWCECGFLMTHIHEHVSSGSGPTPSRWV